MSPTLLLSKENYAEHYPYATRAEALAACKPGQEPYGVRAFGVDRYTVRDTAHAARVNQPGAAPVAKKPLEQTRKGQCLILLQRSIGASVDELMTIFACTKGAATALIGDVKRMGHTVEIREGRYYVN